MMSPPDELEGGGVGQSVRRSMTTCSAPASDRSPNRSTTSAGVSGRAPAVLGDPDVLEGRVLDLVRVAPDRGAMLGQDRVLAGDAFG